MHFLKKTLKDILYTINKNSVSKLLYDQEIKKRSKLSLTDIIPLSKHINMFAPFTNELQPVNDWYGHAKILKKFLGLPESYQFKFNIEHGLYLSEQVAKIELESNLPAFITYSKYRTKVFKKLGRTAYAIGPFIQYAPHYLSKEQLKKERRRLGKTLLFFPAHSLIGLTTYYNVDWSYKKIAEIAKDFKTVRVCMYWKDVLLGKHKYYQNLGWECVTAGHILDPSFLPRLKSIIYNSDLTISNDASSPLSYSIYMNKPHIIFYQQPEMSGQGYLKKVVTDYWKSEPYNQVIKEFSKVQFRITSKQRTLLNYYCGTNSINNKKELLRIIKDTEEIFKTYKRNEKKN
ncbi:hypothetical protein HYS96_02515 [Candidatus Daviesbacteria bacterium]|nr:hypothetical protein [Candidatus Daviesbacteria bacterium]